MTEGIVFRGAPKAKTEKTGVKTKAKKKAYVTAAHATGSAKKKAENRRRRSKRHR